MPYDKMKEFVTSLCDVSQMINKKGHQQKDQKLILISLLISNYVVKIGKDYSINLIEIKNNETTNLIPIFEYINYNNIQLLDFSKLDINDIDVTNDNDLERFVLTHVYYITQT
jgi:hypothetical protein